MTMAYSCNWVSKSLTGREHIWSYSNLLEVEEEEEGEEEELVSNLVFYAQSTIAVISGQRIRIRE